MNGWKNFATWYVWAHYISDQEDHWEDFVGMWDEEEEGTRAYELGKGMKEHMEQLLEDEEQRTSNGIASDLAQCFLDEVNWYEMGQAIVREIKTQEEDA